VRKSVAAHKEDLVQEYRTLLGLAEPQSDHERRRMFDAAVQYIHLNLLQDLSPPWLEHEFPQALPGDGVLSRYLKPCFLRWDIACASKLLGDVITRTLVHCAVSVGLEAVSIVGRPLYVCTQPRKDGICMALAAMSHLMEQRSKHRPFVCSWCKKNNVDVSASDSSRPRRVLQLYLQVLSPGGGITFMRTSPLYIMVAAPSSDWGISLELPTDGTLPGANPEKVKDKTLVKYKFNETDSERLWLHAVSL